MAARPARSRRDGDQTVRRRHVRARDALDHAGRRRGRGHRRHAARRSAGGRRAADQGHSRRGRDARRSAHPVRLRGRPAVGAPGGRGRTAGARRDRRAGCDRRARHQVHGQQPRTHGGLHGAQGRDGRPRAHVVPVAPRSTRRVAGGPAAQGHGEVVDRVGEAGRGIHGASGGRAAIAARAARAHP